MTKIERDRRLECLEADCPVFPDCRVKWGNKCARLYGKKIPRLSPGAYRRAVRRAEPASHEVEQVSTLGTVIWLRRDRDGAAGEGLHPVCHPMQSTFERAADR